MIEVSVAGSAGTPDEVATVAALLMDSDAGFITGSDCQKKHPAGRAARQELRDISYRSDRYSAIADYAGTATYRYWAVIGKRTVNSLPSRRPALIAVTQPPWLSTRLRTNASPMPRRIRLHEQIEHGRQHLRRNADTRIANANDGCTRLPFHGQPHFASRIGVLRRVDEQVNEDLLQSGAVALQPQRRIGDRCGQPVIALSHGVLNGLHGLVHDSAQINSLELQAKLASLDL
jgi:hypothetical protein